MEEDGKEEEADAAATGPRQQPHRKHYRGHYRSNQRAMGWRSGIVGAIYVIYRGLINRLMKQ